MDLKALLLCCWLCGAMLGAAHGFWGEALLDDVVRRFKKDASCPMEHGMKRPKPHIQCDENQFMMQLARLYIISPERIVLLLTAKSMQDTCNEVTDVLHRINNTLATCIALPPSNLYVQLINGLTYYHQFICGQLAEKAEKKKGKHIINYHSCLKELREDLIDCEGPADWFEKANETLVCPFYNDIVGCNYIKTAMLCGLTPAVLLRTFTIEIMKRVVGVKCKVSRSLPRVDQPMPAAGHRLSAGVLGFCSAFFVFCLAWRRQL